MWKEDPGLFCPPGSINEAAVQVAHKSGWCDSGVTSDLPRAELSCSLMTSGLIALKSCYTSCSSWGPTREGGRGLTERSRRHGPTWSQKQSGGHKIWQQRSSPEELRTRVSSRPDFYRIQSQYKSGEPRADQPHVRSHLTGEARTALHRISELEQQQQQINKWSFIFLSCLVSTQVLVLIMRVFVAILALAVLSGESRWWERGGRGG